MPEILNFAKASEPVSDEYGFIRTETALDILRTLTLMQSIKGPAVSMISGAPGIGKTETLMHYERENPQTALRISIPKGEGNVSHVSAHILNLFYPHKGHDNNMTVRRRQIMDSIGKGRILLVDEAQNLFQRNKAACTKGASFGWLVAASEEGGFDLVFCGDLALSSIIMLEFPHLQSRMRRPVLISAAAMGDVVSLAADHGITVSAGSVPLNWRVSERGACCQKIVQRSGRLACRMVGMVLWVGARWLNLGVATDGGLWI